MTKDELMKEACRLAAESVENGWGGPFGAVINPYAPTIPEERQNESHPQLINKPEGFCDVVP